MINSVNNANFAEGKLSRCEQFTLPSSTNINLAKAKGKNVKPKQDIYAYTKANDRLCLDT